MKRSEWNNLTPLQRAEHHMNQFFHYHFVEDNDKAAAARLRRAIMAMTAAGMTPGDIDQARDTRFWCTQVKLDFDKSCERARELLGVDLVT